MLSEQLFPTAFAEREGCPALWNCGLMNEDQALLNAGGDLVVDDYIDRVHPFNDNASRARHVLLDQQMEGMLRDRNESLREAARVRRQNVSSASDPGYRFREARERALERRRARVRAEAVTCVTVPTDRISELNDPDAGGIQDDDTQWEGQVNDDELHDWL